MVIAKQIERNVEMKKIFLLLVLSLILSGCTNEEKRLNEKSKSKDEIVNKALVKDDLTFEYADKVYLYDLFLDENLKKYNENELLDTSVLGKFQLLIKNKNENLSLTYFVKDETPPVINVGTMQIVVHKSLNFLNNMLCGDNYDRELKCEVTGDYDFDKIGVYPLKVIATDTSGNQTVKDFKLNVVKEATSSSQKDYYYFNDLIKNYKTDNTMVGIDVSSWQGTINFDKVAASGCEFVMIRIGFGANKNGEITFDSKFKENLKNAKKAGLKVGLYFYSYAKSKSEAKKQAEWIISALNGESLDLPIAFDWEIWSGFHNYNLNFQDLNEIAETFIQTINNSGYQGTLYSSAFFLNRVWNIDVIPWLAYYTTNNNFEKTYFMWQLSSRGKIDGINAYVDLNVLFKEKYSF